MHFMITRNMDGHWTLNRRKEFVRDFSLNLDGGTELGDRCAERCGSGR